MRTRTKKLEPKIEPPKVEPPKVANASRADPAAPSPDRNLVVFLGESFAVERTDSLNWTAKQRREIDASHHLARGGGHRWEVVGYYSSPGSAFRKIAALMLDNAEAIDAHALAARVDVIFAQFTPAILLAERAKAIADAAENFTGDTRTKLEALAHDYTERANKAGES
jgi:hypothetical protein